MKCLRRLRHRSSLCREGYALFEAGKSGFPPFPFLEPHTLQLKPLVENATLAGEVPAALSQFMVVVGKHFTLFLLIVVWWLKSHHFTAKI